MMRVSRSRPWESVPNGKFQLPPSAQAGGVQAQAQVARVGIVGSNLRGKDRRQQEEQDDHAARARPGDARSTA